MAPSTSKPAPTRTTSVNPPVRPDSKGKPTNSAENIHYTALIRLPFPRGDFVDPPQVEWNTAKDQALWKIISRTSKSSSLDWGELAAKFQVPHTFILQQAAWLYERHLFHVRAQMKKVQAPTTSGSTSSNMPTGGVAMQRLGSGGSTAPTLATRSKVDSPRPDSATSRPEAPSISRTPSTTTVTQSHVNAAPASPRHATRSFRSSFPPSRKASPAIIAPNVPAAPGRADSPASPSVSSSSGSSEDDEPENPISRSQLFKRPPRFAQHKSPLAPLDDASENDPDDEDLSNSDLPFAYVDQKGTAPTLQARNVQNLRNPPSSIREGDSRHNPNYAADNRNHRRALGSLSGIESSASSTSSAAAYRPGQNPSSPPPMSPQHRAQLGRLNPPKHSSMGSPSGKGKGSEAGPSSDGTPSMGSSFSDLDDASVTQSALEDALLSRMANGKMSTLSNLRSKYL